MGQGTWSAKLLHYQCSYKPNTVPCGMAVVPREDKCSRRHRAPGQKHEAPSCCTASLSRVSLSEPFTAELFCPGRQYAGPGPVCPPGAAALGMEHRAADTVSCAQPCKEGEMTCLLLNIKMPFSLSAAYTYHMNEHEATVIHTGLIINTDSFPKQMLRSRCIRVSSEPSLARGELLSGEPEVCTEICWHGLCVVALWHAACQQMPPPPFSGPFLRAVQVCLLQGFTWWWDRISCHECRIFTTSLWLSVTSFHTREAEMQEAGPGCSPLPVARCVGQPCRTRVPSRTKWF